MRIPKNPFASSQLKFILKKSPNVYKINTNKDAYVYLRAIWDKELINVQEQIYVLYLNQVHEVIAWRCLHTGTMKEVLLDKRLLFGFAYGCMAAGIILAHNHPSGILNPSAADYTITKDIAAAAKLLDIRFLDHLIVSSTDYYSLRLR